MTTTSGAATSNMVFVRTVATSFLLLLLPVITAQVGAAVGDHVVQPPTWWFTLGRPPSTHNTRHKTAHHIPLAPLTGAMRSKREVLYRSTSPPPSEREVLYRSTSPPPSEREVLYRFTSPSPRANGTAAFLHLPNALNDEWVGAGSQVVVQEQPYLSQTFLSTQQDRQPFKHYRHFHEESGDNVGGDRDTSISATTEAKSNLRNFAIPETIMKDGQIFYRYDAEIGATGGSIKGQSKRSHSRVSDESESHQHQQHSSQAQTEAHMGDGGQGGKADAVLHSGKVTHALGSADTGGFFSAQAQNVGEDGGMSHTQVLGNIHGVHGSAMTHTAQHQSHAHVQVGPHSSSRARISSQENKTLLISSVDATQVGGSAGAQAYGSATSSSHAHMDFNPSQHLHDNNGLTGHGVASAVVTQEGRSALVSLSGHVSGGQYMGTAHSTTGGTQHSPVAPGADSPPDAPLVLDDYILSGGLLQEDFSHSDFKPPVSRQEESTEEEYVQGDHLLYMQGDHLSNMQGDHLPNVQGDHLSYKQGDHLPKGMQRIPSHEGLVPEEDEQEGSEYSKLTPGRQIQEKGFVTVPPVDPDLPGHSVMNQDMISNIMETVHQPPHMVAQVVAYPGQEASDTVDNGGLKVGAGMPPRESQVGRAPHHQEDTSRHDGKVGEATYSHGRIGRPPGPGELLANLPKSHSHYDYDIYGHSSSEYYGGDYNTIAGQQPPYFDLGPEIFRLEPIELSYEDLQPTASVPPHVTTAEPSIMVHQLQTTTSHLPSNQAPPHLPSSQVPPHLPSSQVPPHLPSSHAPAVPGPFAPPESDMLHHHESNDTVDDVLMSISAAVVGQQPQQQVSPTDIEDGMRSIDLVPSGPGTTLTLPGTTGGPVVNVMTMSASRGTSLLQRPGTAIQPGQKIPGAPGYRVPPGFRGHVILGHNLPIKADSRRVVEGFNTHVQLSPHSPSSSTVFASVSGPQASQHLTKDVTAAAGGVRVTLTDGLYKAGAQAHQPPTSGTQSAGGRRLSSQTRPPPSSHDHTTTLPRPSPSSHGPTNTLPLPPSEPQSSRRTTGQVGREWLWDTSKGRVINSSCCNSKHWPSTGDGRRRPMCRYYPITCRLGYSPYQEGRVCQPLLMCCC